MTKHWSVVLTCHAYWRSSLVSLFVDGEGQHRGQNHSDGTDTPAIFLHRSDQVPARSESVLSQGVASAIPAACCRDRNSCTDGITLMGKKRKNSIRLMRVYDVDDSVEGYRVLVDRLWPRGVKKESLRLDRWVKDLAPCTELRKWFNHDAKKWDEFQRKYREELEEKGDSLRSLLSETETDSLLLIYAAKDTEHNHARILRDVLEEKRA